MMQKFVHQLWPMLVAKEIMLSLAMGPYPGNSNIQLVDISVYLGMDPQILNLRPECHMTAYDHT